MMFSAAAALEINFVRNLQLDITQRDWLRNSGWDRDKENMILVHGYAGGEDGLPMSVLRDGKFVILSPQFRPLRTN